MLDETTCPVCGKEVGHLGPEWAVAHYLAHLVQQKDDEDDEGPDHLTWTADDVHSTDVHPVLSSDVRSEL